MDEKIQDIISNSVHEIEKIRNVSKEIQDVVRKIVECIHNGNKILLFGNGGSAADAQHIAAEFVGRFTINRSSYPAMSLTTDTSSITAIGNDYSFDEIFSRQCENLVLPNDVVIGISTSGNSINVKKGLIEAKKNLKRL